VLSIDRGGPHREVLASHPAVRLLAAVALLKALDVVEVLLAREQGTVADVVLEDDAPLRQGAGGGAKIFDEPALHDYGEEYWADRSYGAIDPEGHHWWFTERVRDPKG
jgi:hypothetical protein